MEDTPPIQPHANVGVLLANLGSPEAPETEAVRCYLKEFLSDPHVVDLPSWLWQPLLRGIILRSRPAKSAARYRTIWTQQGSPLLLTSKAQKTQLQKELQTQWGKSMRVVLGMRYGQPSIKNALDELRSFHCDRLVILPLLPQYSRATVASIYAAVDTALAKWPEHPPVDRIKHYYNATDYIAALVASVEEHWKRFGRADKLLFSFHSLPMRQVRRGDPYPQQCWRTAKTVTQGLGLKPHQWQVAFQSRFGPGAWLKPNAKELIVAWAKQGIPRLDVIAPGFAADCLETLEEINIEYRKLFAQSGGPTFHYIPALNERSDHIKALAGLVSDQLNA